MIKKPDTLSERTSTRLTLDEFNAIVAIAERYGVSVSAAIRESVQRMIKIEQRRILSSQPDIIEGNNGSQLPKPVTGG